MCKARSSSLTMFLALALVFCVAGAWGQMQRPKAASPASDYPMQGNHVTKAGTPIRLNSITTVDASMVAGGNRLVAMQYTDGSWGWPLTAPPTYANIIGPITMGLAQAYQQTGNAAQRTALVNAGAYLLTKTNNFSPSDGYLAAELDKVLGGTTYTAHLMTNFYNPLAAGTYDYKGLGILYTTAGYINKIRVDRGGNLAAWDLGMGLVAAASCGASTTDWIAGVKAEIDELNGALDYDVIGLAGAVYGLAYVNENFDPTSGVHASAGSLSDLAAILATYQIGGGGFTYHMGAVSAGSETNQETAYAILALDAINRTTYVSNIQGAANFLIGKQFLNGGWDNFVSDPDGENNELTAEAVWGISAAYPAPVHNITKDVYYPAIQAAVNDAAAGNSIEVAAGTFSEVLSINKALILLGANANINPNTGVRVTETILDYSSIPDNINLIQISAPGKVVMNGFKIVDNDATATGDRNDIFFSTFVDHEFKFNILSRASATSTTEPRAIMIPGSASGSITIDQNLIQGKSNADLFNNKGWKRGIWSDGGGMTTTITNNIFQYCRTAMNLDSYTSAVNVTGNTFQENGTALSFGLVPSGNYTISGNTFNNAAFSTVYNLSGGIDPSAFFDATANTYDGKLAAAMTSDELFTLEYRIVHRMNIGKNGFVMVKSNNAFVVPASSEKAGLIQNGINAASNGWTVNVAAGTYNEHSITIDKSLTLTGDPGDAQPGTGVNAPVVDGQDLWTDAFVLANGVSNVTIQGFEIRNYTAGTGSGSGNAIQAWVASTNHITIADNYMHDLRWNGVLVGNDGAIGDHSYWTIARNILSNYGTGTFSYSGYGLELTNTGNGVIEDNIISAGTRKPASGIMVVARRSEHDVTIRRNNVSGAMDYAGILVQAWSADVANPNLDAVTINNNIVDITLSSATSAALIIYPVGTGTITNSTVNNNMLTCSGGGKSIKSYTPTPVNASGNWLGTTSPASAVNANVDYTPWLNTGTDTDLATAGFQGDFSNLWVGAASPQTGATPRIAEGLGLLSGTPKTLHVAAGTYAEAVTIGNTMNSLSFLGTGATIDPPGSADGVQIYADQVAMSGFAVTNSLSGVVVLGNKASIKNCSFTDYTAYGVAVSGKDYAVIQNNSFTGAAGTVGVYLLGAQQCAVSGNTISGNDVNVKVIASTSPARTARNNNIRSNTLLNPIAWSVVSDPVLNKVNFNVFSTATTSNKYVENTSGTVPLNAQYNWFGGEAPPGTNTLPDFSGNVDFANYFATNPTLFINPTSQYVPVGSPVVVTVSGMLPAGVYAKGSSVTMNWTDDAHIPDVTVPVDGSFFDDGVGPVFFDYNPHAFISSVKVDQALMNNNAPGGVGNATLFPYIGDLFSVTFQPSAAGTSTITLTGNLLRAPDNTPMTVDVLPVGAAVLTADAALPTVTAVLIDNTSLNTDQNLDTFDDYVKNTDNVTITATVSDDNALTAADIVADLTPFGGGAAVNPNTYVAPSATWTYSSINSTPSNGTNTITVTATDVVSNTGSASDDITADNTLPDPPTDFKAFTNNATGGHGKVNLTWTSGADAPDGTYKGLVAQYNTWTYPTYAADPGYPATATAGAGTVSATPLAGTSTVHAIVPRGIYNYAGFSVDWAGNYSTAATSAQQDRAANYFLGDLGSGAGENLPGDDGYDGSVDFDDLIWFSNAYFTSSGAWDNTNRRAEVDFGPTILNKTYAANHRLAIPDPDGAVNFEDLMIFSMNYMNTTPKVAEPGDRQLARQFAVELMKGRSTTSQGEMLSVTVRVANDGREIKGIAAALNFNPSELQFVDATSGGLFGSQQQGFVFAKAENNKVQIDAAVLGIDRTINFSGNLAVVRFRVLHAGQGDVTIDNAVVRSGSNSEQIPVLNNNAVALPASFSLTQNYPNPFNPTTRIDYQVPATSPVTVEVFNVLGEKVATLVNEVKEAGYYNVVWNGKNMANQQVASGLYIYTMRAGDFTNVKKMMLLK